MKKIILSIATLITITSCEKEVEEKVDPMCKCGIVDWSWSSNGGGESEWWTVRVKNHCSGNWGEFENDTFYQSGDEYCRYKEW